MAPLTGVTEYVFTAVWQVVVFPVILPGVAGIELTVTAKVCDPELPHPLFAITVILPPVVFEVVAILVVVELPDHPPGKVQVYEVAPLIAVMEYVFDDPEQILALPLIAPGVAGTEFTVTANV